MAPADELVIYALNGLYSASILFLISSGLTLIFGVAGIVNLTHGSFFMLGAYMTASLTRQFFAPPFSVLSGFLATMLISAALGIAIERGLLRLIYGRDETYQLLLTFGLTLIFSDAMRFFFGSQPVSSPYLLLELGTLKLGVVEYPLYNVLVILVALAIGGILWSLLYRTRLGLMIRACSHDREMSAALGLRTGRVFAIVFTLGVALSALSGAFASQVSAAFLGMDANALIEAFVVIVVGGLGSVKGALLGSVIIGLARSFGVAFIPELELALIYLVMAIVLIARPRGLFGREYRVV